MGRQAGAVPTAPVRGRKGGSESNSGSPEAQVSEHVRGLRARAGPGGAQGGPGPVGADPEVCRWTRTTPSGGRPGGETVGRETMVLTVDGEAGDGRGGDVAGHLLFFHPCNMKTVAQGSVDTCPGSLRLRAQSPRPVHSVLLWSGLPDATYSSNSPRGCSHEHAAPHSRTGVESPPRPFPRVGAHSRGTRPSPRSEQRKASERVLHQMPPDPRQEAGCMGHEQTTHTTTRLCAHGALAYLR